MKVMVCGSRSIKDRELVEKTLERELNWDNVDKVIHGGAEGVDSIVEEICSNTKVFRPDYDKYPYKVAPRVRNKDMVDEADKVIAIWDGESSGTKSVIDYCEKEGVDYVVKRTDHTDLSNF